MRAAFGLWLGIALWLCCARGAAADDAKANVKQLYQSAITHYNLSEYKEALTDFKAAYRLKPDPAFLFNIAQCHRQLGEPTAAARHYRAFLREAPAAPNRVEVEKVIAEMDHAAVEERARRPPLGTESPRSEKPDKTESTEKPVEPATVVKPEVAPVPVKPETPETRPSVERTPSTSDAGRDVGGRRSAVDGVGLALVVVGVVGLGLGAGLAGGGAAQKSAADADPDVHRVVALRDQAATLGVVGYVALGVGGAALIAGIVKWALRPRQPSKVMVGLLAQPGAVAAQLSVRF